MSYAIIIYCEDGQYQHNMENINKQNHRNKELKGRTDIKYNIRISIDISAPTLKYNSIFPL